MDRDDFEKYGYACTAIRSDAANGEDLLMPFYSQFSCSLHIGHIMQTVNS